MYAEIKTNQAADLYVQEMRTLLEAAPHGVRLREAEALRELQVSLLGDEKKRDKETGRIMKTVPTSNGCLKRFLAMIEFQESCWL